MKLLQNLRRERKEKKVKQPFKPTLFDRISTIVRVYSLDEGFLRKLEGSGYGPCELEWHRRPMKAKMSLEMGLFSLTSEEEYRVTTAIIETMNNPYLHFVCSPDEILLCGLLFTRNPSLSPDKLAGYHFETLLRYVMARQEEENAGVSS